ncbi:Crp/Fnr family transcriptional regulator [Sporichthya sp.]|uniref:Crp/Fnr family transcriptional regulator n=1 Tax=Sporichthya sp. TaxID=65475 RepID=UPI0017E78C57|nr:cyclic nucleotide-binding domain-containing protein [Sporichthya sp.]MBA3742221.1 cyclic nucleotide-binding domain-containing protein [Sporichthya sp.]
MGTRRGYPAGAILFMEGDVAHEAVVLLEGDLKVVVGSADGRDVVLDVFGPGELVGEWSVIDGKTRSATVTALSDVEVLSLPAAPFRAFLDRHPEVREGLLLDTIGRLRAQVRTSSNSVPVTRWAAPDITVHDLDRLRCRATH